MLRLRHRAVAGVNERGLPNSSLKSDSHRQPKILALGEVCARDRTLSDDRRLYFDKGITFGDSKNLTQGILTVVARADDDSHRQRVDLTLDLVKGAVEKVFKCAGHIAEVFRRSKDYAVRPQNVARASSCGGKPLCYDVANLRTARTRAGRVDKPSGVAGLAVVDDKKMLH